MNQDGFFPRPYPVHGDLFMMEPVPSSWITNPENVTTPPISRGFPCPAWNAEYPGHCIIMGTECKAPFATEGRQSAHKANRCHFCYDDLTKKKTAEKRGIHFGIHSKSNVNGQLTDLHCRCGVKFRNLTQKKNHQTITGLCELGEALSHGEAHARGESSAEPAEAVESLTDLSTNEAESDSDESVHNLSRTGPRRQICLPNMPPLLPKPHESSATSHVTATVASTSAIGESQYGWKKVID